MPWVQSQGREGLENPLGCSWELNPDAISNQSEGGKGAKWQGTVGKEEVPPQFPYEKTGELQAHICLYFKWGEQA